MRKIFIAIFFLCLIITAYSQEYTELDLNNQEMRALKQDSIKKVNKKYKSLHMVGIKYGYNISSARISPDMGPKSISMPLNISLLYTYYTDLWDMLPNFGIQLGMKYGEEGFDAEYMEPERFKITELSMLTQFRINFSRYRILVNAGPYMGYRLKNNRKNGKWDKYDNRYDYGIIGGAGFAIIFKPFEIQFEGNYKYSLSSMYHVNKLSDEYWLLAYPSNIMLSVSLFVHLW